ncbi:MAG: hypothetical protein ACT4QC_06295 [Planctomycetaceae bacterium]
MHHPESISVRSADPRVRTADRPMRPADDFLAYLHEYSREQPETVALVCLGLGFILGWKLKPW